LYKLLRLANVYTPADLPLLERLGWERVTILLDVSGPQHQHLQQQALEGNRSSRELRLEALALGGYRKARGRRQARGRRPPAARRRGGVLALRDLLRQIRQWLEFDGKVWSADPGLAGQLAALPQAQRTETLLEDVAGAVKGLQDLERAARALRLDLASLHRSMKREEQD
jgi:hypothetical protein